MNVAMLKRLALFALIPGILASPGDVVTIPGWHLQSSLRAPRNLSELSIPGANVAWWYRTGRRTTVMAGLIENKVYNDTALFFSDNLQSVDSSLFQVPWLYREELNVEPPKPEQHIFLITHGITSKADIFFNGAQIASPELQQGSYVGRRYEITPFVQPGPNALLIQAYPTNYQRDLAVGFIDWNPRPPDNGTGVWRDVELKHTGLVSMSPPRVQTDFTDTNAHAVVVTVKTDIENHGDTVAEGSVQGTVTSDDGTQISMASTTFKLGPRGSSTASINARLMKPRIWWPAEWGKQPLYTVRLNITVNANQISDVAPPTTFGIRRVTSEINSHEDIVFEVNGQPFRVRGGGYSPDMFLRFDVGRIRTIFQYMLDMGLNTVRLEGKQEHPELYSLADEMGLMIIAGWECCDKWEAWKHNRDSHGERWTDQDYKTAHASMLHETEMMQTHPSMLAFLIGSDSWPDNRAAGLYTDALKRMDWPNPVVASASKQGFPNNLGPSGMKMDGPYDWVPPNYWFGSRRGAAFGFGSELGPGVGTPELDSLKRFLSPHDLNVLWTDVHTGLYHMPPSDLPAYDRSFYNKALFTRYGRPTGLEDYVQKAQMMDYEATRGQFEVYAVRQNATRPATGVVYWMLNSAWPSLHWQLLDYYLRPAGAYSGAKTALRSEHVALDYETQEVYVINHSLGVAADRLVLVDLISMDGTSVSHQQVATTNTPNSSTQVTRVAGIDSIRDVGFLRLILQDAANGTVLSRNVYWLPAENDRLTWEQSTWYTTPMARYANLTALSGMPQASVALQGKCLPFEMGLMRTEVELENLSDVPAFFLRLVIRDNQTQEPAPVYWSDNYITLFPREKIKAIVSTRRVSEPMIIVSGANTQRRTISLN